MALEIERKFLLADESWRDLVSHSERFRDGLIAAMDGRKVRVRVYEDRATLTVKSRRVAGSREEYEYEIPLNEAHELLERHCERIVLSKTRYYVPIGELIWEIDVYEGILAGVVLAEVELPSLDYDLVLPKWIAEEVTDRADYRKVNMVRARTR